MAESSCYKLRLSAALDDMPLSRVQTGGLAQLLIIYP